MSDALTSTDPPLFERLAGLETEYALHWLGPSQPSRESIFDALDEVIQNRLTTARGMQHRRRFLENGGSYSFEHQPHVRDNGLFEAATPECSAPSVLLLYQKAQDTLVTEAIPPAEEQLRRAGHVGQLVVLKNALDADGHRYGPQESYSVCAGARYPLFVLGLVALTPLVVLSTVVLWVLFVPLIILLLAAGVTFLLAMLVWMLVRSTTDEQLERSVDRFEERLAQLLLPIVQVAFAPCGYPFLALVRGTLFSSVRRRLTAFVICRPVLCGTGTLDKSGVFHLSEKGSSLRAILRRSTAPSSASVYDVGNLLKALDGLVVLDGARYLALFRRRQRMQIGASEANHCQWSEYIKVGVTMLVLDMIEAGALDDAPELVRPLEASKVWNEENGFRQPQPTRAHGELSALEVQRFYLERAERWLRDRAAVSMEAREIVRQWRWALDALAPSAPLDTEHPAFGRMDWVTKRALMSDVLEPEGSPSFAMNKKVDLGYAELGRGYFAQLEEAGAVLRLVNEDDRNKAMTNPPEATPATARGALIRELAKTGRPLRITWDRARVDGRLGGRIGGEVIPFRRP